MNSDNEKRKAVAQTLPAPGPWEGTEDNDNYMGKVNIHNLVTGVVRTVNREQECLTDVELSAYRSCIDRGETISMGSIIVEPVK